MGNNAAGELAGANPLEYGNSSQSNERDSHTVRESGDGLTALDPHWVSPRLYGPTHNPVNPPMSGLHPAGGALSSINGRVRSAVMTGTAHILPRLPFPMAALCLGLTVAWGARGQAQAQGHAITPTGGINGQVVDQLSRQPVIGATVNLIGTRLHAATDSAGRFSHASLGAGTYILEVRAIGYGVTSWVLRLSDAEVVDYIFEVAPIDIELDPIVVEGRPGYFQRRMQEFEERRRAGRGIFITHDQIEASHAATMADLLRGVPGVRLNCRSGICTAQMTRTAHGVCAADWVVDGMPASVSSTPHLPVVGIVAVEIYRSPNEAPAEFLKADSDCGVIAIWTKSGP